ncbi:hypothetical protein LRH25_15475 [Ideonella azotifigens]|uniref:Lipoprotein n=1 Tax=Ideonella azotifigens TaxID=513160 RepID=A0ABP3V8S4_9BURK|nr:hypothetical protein [Ideonella azotifigens]MCD2341745.1 hypothetical protein [Ideonella azotifigens]
MKRFCGISVVALAAAILGGCGGGNADESGSSTVYATNAAWANLYASAHSWSLSGTVSGSGQNTSVSSTLDLSLLADGTFPGTGEAAKIRRLTTTATANGGSSSDYVTHYLNASNAFVGTVSSDGSCALPSNVGLPPTSAAMGNSGPLASWTEYSSCSAGSPQIGTGAATWSVEKADSTPYFCVTNTYTSTAAGNSFSSTEKDCFEINTSGTIGSAAKVSAVYTQNGVNTTVSMSTL